MSRKLFNIKINILKWEMLELSYAILVETFAKKMENYARKTIYIRYRWFSVYKVYVLQRNIFYDSNNNMKYI